MLNIFAAAVALSIAFSLVHGRGYVTKGAIVALHAASFAGLAWLHGGHIATFAAGASVSVYWALFRRAAQARPELNAIDGVTTEEALAILHAYPGILGRVALWICLRVGGKTRLGLPPRLQQEGWLTLLLAPLLSGGFLT